MDMVKVDGVCLRLHIYLNHGVLETPGVAFSRVGYATVMCRGNVPKVQRAGQLVVLRVRRVCTSGRYR